MYALEELNSARWIEDDCNAAAIVDCSKMGIEAATTNERTVAGWNILLRRANREHFPMPYTKILHKQKQPLPELLEYFPDEIRVLHWEPSRSNSWDDTKWIGDFLDSNTAARTSNSSNIAILGNNTISKVGLHKDLEQDTQQGEEDNSILPRKTSRGWLLHVYLESPISLSTTWRWLRRRLVGFSYDTRKTSFFRWPRATKCRFETERVLHSLSNQAQLLDSSHDQNCRGMEERKHNVSRWQSRIQ